MKEEIVMVICYVILLIWSFKIFIFLVDVFDLREVLKILIFCFNDLILLRFLWDCLFFVELVIFSFLMSNFNFVKVIFMVCIFYNKCFVEDF